MATYLITQGPPLAPLMTINDLWEYVSDSESNSGIATWDDSSETITFDFPGDNSFTGPKGLQKSKKPIAPARMLYDATLLLLGYAWTQSMNTTIASDMYNSTNTEEGDPEDTEPGGDMPASMTSENQSQQICFRYLPCQHPIKPSLVCTRLEWKGVAPRGKQRALFVQPMGYTQPYYTSLYAKIRCTATFTAVKYELKPNLINPNAVQPINLNVTNGSELYRFTYINGNNSVNFITLDQGTMVYLQGPPPGPQGQTIVGKPINAPGYHQAEIMQDLVVQWTNVPESYVCNTNVIPVRLLNSLGKVNSAPFLGRAPGTLLMDPFEYERRRMPLPDKFGVSGFWADIKLHLKYFNPQYGPLPKGQTPLAYGHQTAPAPAGTAFGYYAIQNQGNGAQRYQSYDFNQFFTPLTADEAAT
jgi:hypothetical protein